MKLTADCRSHEKMNSQEQFLHLFLPFRSWFQWPSTGADDRASAFFRVGYWWIIIVIAFVQRQEEKG